MDKKLEKLMVINLRFIYKYLVEYCTQKKFEHLLFHDQIYTKKSYFIKNPLYLFTVLIR